jgi:hypothetical protein
MLRHRLTDWHRNWEKFQKKFADDEVEEKKIDPLTDEDIQVLRTCALPSAPTAPSAPI